MALYRNTSTGFLGEYATAPGSPWVAVGAMPTDTIQNRAMWWRNLDLGADAPSWTVSSAWHPSLYRLPEDPNEAIVSLQFTQEVALISADPSGTVTNPKDSTNTYYLGASADVRVYRGISDVTITEEWQLSKVDDGCVSTLDNTGGIYSLKITSIPLVTTTSGFVRVTATKTGSGTFTRDFRFLKVFQGQDGTSGTVIDLSNDSHTVPTDADGNNGNYNGAITTAYIYIGSTDDSANWTWSVSASTGVTGTASNLNRTYAVTNMTVDVGTVVFSASKIGQTTRTATFTVSKAKGGVSYSLQTSVSSVSKSKGGVYNPDTILFSALKITTSGVSNYAGRFKIETQATLGGAWSTAYSSATDQSSYTYTVPATIVSVKATLYQAGGLTAVLDSESVPVVFDGQDGTSGTVIDLSNDSHTVPTDADGNNGNYNGAITTATVYAGAVDDSANWTWSVSASTGVTGTASNLNRTYVVTNMTVDVGTVTFTATRTGYASLTAIFTISKAKGGVSYSLQTSVGAISKLKDGTYSPSSVIFSGYKQTTTTTSAYGGRFIIETQASIGGVWSTRYTSTVDETTTTYTVPASIVAVRGSLYLAGGTTVLVDREGLPVVSDGQDGAPGVRGSRQIVISGTADWTDLAAWNAIINQFGGTAPILSDLVTIVNTATNTSTSKFYTGGNSPGTWVIPTAYINGNLLVTGTVGANQLAANSIITDKIAIGQIDQSKLNFGMSGQNLLPNAGPTLGAELVDWTLGAYTTTVAPTVGAGFSTWRPTEGASVFMNVSNTVTAGQSFELNGLSNGSRFPVIPGKKYEASAYLSAHRCIGRVAVNWYDVNGALISSAAGSDVTTSGSGVLTNWGRSTLIVQSPSNAAAAMFICRGVGNGGSGAYLFLTRAYFGRALDNQVTASDWSQSGFGTLIDGTGIRTNSITATQIKAGTITATQIAVGTITAASAIIADAAITNLKISDLSASKLTAGTIDARTITVDHLNASNIKSGTLDVARLSFTPVGTGNVVSTINASSEGLRIASNKIFIDGSVTFSPNYDPTGKISSGGAATDINNNTTEINGGKIRTGSLTANAIGTGTLSAATITLGGASSVIKSADYPNGPGNNGQAFRISGDGLAFFYGVAVKGSIRSANWNGTVNASTGQPSAGTGSDGWCIDNAGNAEFNTAIVRKPSNIGNAAYGASAKIENTNYATGTSVNLTVGTYYYKANVGQTTNILLTLDCQTSLSTNLINVTDGADNLLWTAYNKNGAAIDSRFFSGSTSFYTTVNQSYVTLKVYMESGGGTMGVPRINIFEIVS